MTRGRQLRELLALAGAGTNVGTRVGVVSASLLGSPYRADPLVGSPEAREELTFSLDAFDCVTFVESVYSLALSRSQGAFESVLRRLRYEGGKVSYPGRNHYMTDWIRNNGRAGLLQMVRLGPREIEKRRVLDVVKGVVPRVRRFRCLPKRFVRGAAGRLRTGDLICFASTRSHLDVFHCGLVFRDGDSVRLRHASRGQGGVVEQDLFDFLRRNRMAGVIVARPVERGRA